VNRRGFFQAVAAAIGTVTLRPKPVDPRGALLKAIKLEQDRARYAFQRAMQLKLWGEAP
jgi:hypothetical protein